MADIFTKKRRSAIMARIRSSGTSPERLLQSIVRRILGTDMRIDFNVTRMPGQPDVLIPQLRLVIFADGCFYHNCPLHGHRPKSNEYYWTPKLARTVKRDAANRRKLRVCGFRVWRFWEHQFTGRNAERTFQILERRLGRVRELQGRNFDRLGRSSEHLSEKSGFVSKRYWFPP